VLGVLVLVLVVDLALRALAPFELHDGWEHQQIAWKEDKFRQFARGGPVDVLLAGSSVIMSLDARRMSAQAKARVFNGGIGSGNPTAMGAILEHMYLPIAKPKLVVYAVSPRDMRDSGDAFDQPPFFSHRVRSARAWTWQERVEVVAERYSYLLRVRRQLRDLATRGEQPRGTEIKTDGHGSRIHKGQRLARSLKGLRAFPADYGYRRRYRDYQIDYERGHARQLVSLIQRNSSLGIRTILVKVPLSPAGMSLFDHPDADYRLYSQALKRVARRTHVELYDAHHDLQLPNEDFFDADHMGARGDIKTQDYLAPIIERELASAQN
jgi:hypothetical protein